MAYVPKVAKDRALWITPKEAVAHVCEVEQYDSKEAKQQIVAALKDRVIETRWADSDPSAFKDPGIIINRDLGMSRDGAQGTMIGHTIVSWDPGAARCLNPDNKKQTSWLELRAGKLPPEKVYAERPLLLLKRHVMKLWPTKGSTTPDTPPLVVSSKTPKSPSDRIVKIKQRAVTKASEIEVAAKILFKKNRTSETCGSWPKFCRELRVELEVTETTRGYSNSTIENLVRPLLSKKR